MKQSGLFFAMVLTFSLASHSYAQFSIGPRIAANIANVESEQFGESLDTDSRFGFAFGAAVEIGISQMFAIQPEVLYSQHGFKFLSNDNGDVFEIKGNHNYLQIPILAKIKFGSNPAHYYVVAGPHIGMGIGDFNTETTENDETVEESVSWEDAGLKTLDYGLTGGAGISFPAGPGSIGIDVRYQFGLANFMDEPEGDDFIKNRNLQIGMSYMIPLGGN